MSTKKSKVYETDVVVVGSGPGGATMAYELSKKGKKVIICEAGDHYTKLGKFYSPGKMMDKGGMTFSKEKLLLNIGKTVGGLSMIFAATASKPPAWLKDKYGINLDEEIEETFKEIQIQPLPESLIGPGARLLMESARSLGLDWQLTDKYIRPEKCKPNCGACSLGCATGAKWTARDSVEKAIQNGATLLSQTKVEKVLTKGGKAAGVAAKGPNGNIEINADTVVVSAGGSVSPVILQKSGLTDVGKTLIVDPVLFVWGVGPNQGNMRDVSITAGTYLNEEGILLSDISFPTMLTLGSLAYTGAKGLAFTRKALQHNKKLLAVMVKVRDEANGSVSADGTISKIVDEGAKQRLKNGVLIAENILSKSGVKMKDILVGKELGGHPGGTVPIGQHLDKYCQTEIANCYCVDNSIFPEPMGLPPTLTVISMAKRIVKHMTADLTHPQKDLSDEKVPSPALAVA